MGYLHMPPNFERSITVEVFSITYSYHWDNII